MLFALSDETWIELFKIGVQALVTVALAAVAAIPVVLAAWWKFHKVEAKQDILAKDIEGNTAETVKAKEIAETAVKAAEHLGESQQRAMIAQTREIKEAIKES